MGNIASDNEEMCIQTRKQKPSDTYTHTLYYA